MSIFQVRLEEGLPKDRMTRVQYARRNSMLNNMCTPLPYLEQMLHSTARFITTFTCGVSLCAQFQDQVCRLNSFHTWDFFLFVLVVYAINKSKKSNTNTHKFVFIMEFRLIHLPASPITGTLFSSVIRTTEHSKQDQNLFVPGVLDIRLKSLHQWV